LSGNSRAALAVFGVLALVAVAEANPQAPSACTPHWEALDGKAVGTVNNYVRALTEFDDGSGTALFVAGEFTQVGGQPMRTVCKWQNGRWVRINAPGSSWAPGYALRGHDDGSGPALYVGGQFAAIDGVAAQNLARWDGAGWSAVGGFNSGVVCCFAEFDSGSGPQLYVGGYAGAASGVGRQGIARWDGSAWSDVGVGLPSNGVVNNMTVFDDGTGPALYLGGSFTSIDGVAVDHIARWDGQAWSSVGGGVSGTVNSLIVHDDGSGPALFVCGSFLLANGAPATRVAKWDGQTWSALGAGFTRTAVTLGSYDDGSGNRLYIGLDVREGATSLHTWDGAVWTPAPGAIDGVNSGVGALQVHDDGAGSRLFVGGWYSEINGIYTGPLMTLDANGWLSVDIVGRDREVSALAVEDLGGGPQLLAGASADIVDFVPLRGAGAWDGAQWSDVGGPFNGEPKVFATYDDGSGPAVYVGGAFTEINGVPANHIAKWNGSSWTPLGSGVDGVVRALAVYDAGAGPQLFAGGGFTVAGGLPANRIASWDGVSWAPLGAGASALVRTLCVYDSGSGPELIVGGDFSSAGGMTVGRIAKWGPSGWSKLLSGLSSAVRSLAVFDAGAGEELYACGNFVAGGGVGTLLYIARWNGTTWNPVGGGLNSPGHVLTVFDDGSGEALYVGGEFTQAGGVPTGAVARWNGSSWSGLDSSFVVGTTEVTALQGFTDASGPALYIGGTFTDSPVGDSYLTVWRGCNTQPTTFCTPQAPGTTSGCIATISASGQPDVTHSNPCTLTVSNVEGDKVGLLFYGVNGQVSTTWCASSANRLCVASPKQRMGTQSSGGTAGACDGTLVEDWNVYQLSHTAALGNPWLAGAVVDVQAWFRDPPACKTTSLSQGIRLTYQ